LTVTLIERDRIAAHASGRSAGNLNPLHATPPDLIPFALEAFRIHDEVRAELTRLGCAKYVARPVKRIHLGFEEADRTRLEETAGLFESSRGFSAAWLDSNDLRRMEPRLSPEARFGLLTEGCLSLDGCDFTHSLADGAIKLGATVLHDTVSGVAACGQRVTGVRTAKGAVACDDLILATGPWVSDTESWLGISLAVEPVKGEILLMRMREGTPRYDFTWKSTSLYRRRENEVWLGITMQKCGFDCTPTAEAKQSLLNRAARIMPAIRDAQLLDHIAALRPMTPAPLAARADGWENVYIANGGGSKGVLLSVGIARRIRDLLLYDG